MNGLDRIDVHAHAFPRPLLQALGRRYPTEVRLQSGPNGRLMALWNKAPLPEFDLKERIEAMDREGVEREILSVPPIYGRFDDQTRHLCRLVNELQSEICASAPGRFSCFVHLPYHESEASRIELERCLEDPSFVGVTLASNMNGTYPGTDLAWLWDALVENQFPIFVHPVAPCGVVSPLAMPLVHFPTDTAVCASHLIMSGTLEQWPDLAFVLPHYGGTLPIIASRLDMILHPHFPPHLGIELSRPPSTYVSRFYVDTAQGFSHPAYRFACDIFGVDRILYGSDYFLLDTPWRRDLNAFLDEAIVSPRVRAHVLRGNAERLFNRAWLRSPTSA